MLSRSVDKVISESELCPFIQLLWENIKHAYVKENGK